MSRRCWPTYCSTSLLRMSMRRGRRLRTPRFFRGIVAHLVKLDPQVPDQQEDIEKMVPTAPGLEGEGIGRLKGERLTWIVDLCRLAKVGRRPSPKPQTTTLCLVGSQELIQIRSSSFVAATKLMGAWCMIRSHLDATCCTPAEHGEQLRVAASIVE